MLYRELQTINLRQEFLQVFIVYKLHEKIYRYKKMDGQILKLINSITILTGKLFATLAFGNHTMKTSFITFSNSSCKKLKIYAG